MSDDSVVSINTGDIISIAKPYRLQFEEAQDSWVLLYPEGMVNLNPSSAEILQRCDGKKTVASIIAELEQQFPDVELADDVREFVQIALSNGWLQAK